MTRRAPRLRALAAALAATAGLAACSGQLPTQPAPERGLPVSVQTRPDVERFLSQPQPGASRTEVVRGFLQANVGFADEGEVTRSYLTHQLAREWVPTQDILVYDGTPEVVEEPGGAVRVDVQVVGRIDAQGRLVEQTGGRGAAQSFSLQKVDQEWRISGFPEGFGLWLSRTDLEQSFRPTTLYYLNPQSRSFVPEVRWLAQGEGRATALVRAQLAPLPTHLEGAVRSPGAEGVQLASTSVPVDPATGHAVVSLSGPGLAADETLTTALQAQLAHALLGLSGVTRVQVQLAGQALSLPDQEGEEGITTLTELPYTDVERRVDMLLLRTGERFTPVDPSYSSLRNLPADRGGDLDLPRLDEGWMGVAATADLRDLAAVSTDRTSLWRWTQGEEHTNPGIGDELTPPAVDPLDGFWVGGLSRSTGAPRVWVSDRATPSTARPLDTPWLHERDRLQSLSVSPDGSRALLIVGETGAERRRLLLCGVERDGSGAVVGLTPGVALAPTLDDVLSARWATSGDVYLVGRRADDPRMRAFSLRVGEWLTPMGSGDALSPVDVLAIPRGTGAEPIARTADGRFHVTEGSQGWAPARNGDEIVVPGG